MHTNPLAAKPEGRKIDCFIYMSKLVPKKQEGVFLNLAKRTGLSVVKIFKESSPINSAKRVVLEQMISEINSGKAQGIICFSLTSLTNNPKYVVSITNLIWNRKLRIIATPNKIYKAGDNSVIFSILNLNKL
jgi:DNA invertase Pin-like site-specific DNA recombinase